MEFQLTAKLGRHRLVKRYQRFKRQTFRINGCHGVIIAGQIHLAACPHKSIGEFGVERQIRVVIGQVHLGFDRLDAGLSDLKLWDLHRGHELRILQRSLAAGRGRERASER